MRRDRPTHADERAAKVRGTGHEETSAANACASAPPPVRYAVTELLRGEREAVLEHGGAEYRLRVTSKGRLILTK
jgi:hemin uptake protein HemP